MIDKKDFYDNNDSPDSGTRSRIWKNVKREIDERKQPHYKIDFRSFAFGMAAAVILFFTFIGVRTTFLNYMENTKPIDERINQVYLETINKFENKLPIILADRKRSVKLDDMIDVQQEELQSINEAIKDLKSYKESFDQSPIKQRRLRELYKMKLEIINEIIAIEEEIK